MAYQRFEGVDVEGKMVGLPGPRRPDRRGHHQRDPKGPRDAGGTHRAAWSPDGAETGRREVLIGPSDARTVQVTAIVKSYERPLVGDIYGCGTEVPAYLRRTG